MKIRIKTFDSECSGIVIGRTLRWLYVRVDKHSVAFLTTTGVCTPRGWRLTPAELAKALEFTATLGEAPIVRPKGRPRTKVTAAPAMAAMTAAMPPHAVIPFVSKDDRLAMIAKSARRTARR